MRTRFLLVVGFAVAMALLPGTALAFDAPAYDATCVAACHSHPGFTDFTSWHSSHQVIIAAQGTLETCNTCHQSGHTIPTDSAPQTIFAVSEACGPCHGADAILGAHAGAGVASCSECHPASVRRGALSGVVSQAAGPLSGVLVSVAGMPTVVTGPDGAYTVSGIPAGLCSVTFSKAGYLPRTLTMLYISNGGTTLQNVVLYAAPPSDAVPPVTTTDATTAYYGSATIRLSAGDVGSGVAHTYYRLDGAPQAEGVLVQVSGLGSHVLEFWSVDVAGNEETHRSALFTVAPAVSPTAVTIRRSASTVRAGRSVTLSGAVVPAGMAGGPVVIYVKRPGSTRWVYLTTRTAYASGDGAAWQYRYTMKRTLRRGYHRFKAVVPLQAGFLSSTSGVVTVRLR